ncbi:hypothetical protein PHISCL_10007 [Aspergillus sclerotialis]|uniref:Uncharacterized protein n=1 Tax=Aspergillus sclerotialis TaxID=2070753 RepID=A0A3A2Z8P6_9EURO|nr:hypothetical protein PHISCL_10007 [Aspergillus sclerotialis]
MGRKTFFQDAENLRKRLERCAANGYVPRAHFEEDVVRKRHDHTDEVKQLHKQYVKLYEAFLVHCDYEKTGYELKRGCPAPDHVVIKDFIRFYVRSVRGSGRLSDTKLPTVRTTLACAERFFGGFEEATGSTIKKDDRDEVYSACLTEEGEIEDVKKEKFDFTRNDYKDLLASMWTRDCPVFIHGLLKVFMLFALQVFLFTGARIGAFIPDDKHKDQRGLRFKHLELVLFRSPNPNEPWKIGFRINQQWLKKHRSPKYTVFGIGIRDNDRPQFASGIMLLIIAIKHGALWGIDTLDDIAEYDLRHGSRTEIPLRWKTESLEAPVFRNVTAQGPQEVPLTKQRFCYFLRWIFIAAGYSNQATIHDVRRQLGTKIEARHGSAPVSQIYSHRSASTYPEHYLAHCSSIDTVGDVLDEPNETYHIEYWQGYRQFREVGFPTTLPAEKEKSILENAELVGLKSRIQDLLGKGDLAAAESVKREYRRKQVRLRVDELSRHQGEWFRERRDQRILNRGNGDVECAENHTCARALVRICPS